MFGSCRPAALLPIAAIIFTPERALADSAIDAAIKPYFVIGGWATALLFLGIGSLLLPKAIRNLRLSAAAAQWPTADGTIISADIVKRVSKSDDAPDYFVPQIRYAYKANGIRRQGDVIRIGLGDMGYPKEKRAREHIALYPIGAIIPVRYDPQNPEYAVLESGQIGVTRKILAGSIFVGIGMAAIVFAIWTAGLPTR
jgi:hypothetical protein